MSLKITRQGILDTVQDTGRFGYQHLGVNCNGAMDSFSAQLANALLGNALHSPTIEMHFPASQILFQAPAIICITGADFQSTLNGREIPLNHPVAVSEGVLLNATKMKSGARSYLGIWNSLGVDVWMNSNSTNLKAGVGGWNGRALTKDDIIPFRSVDLSGVLREADFMVLPWKAARPVEESSTIDFIIGSEWHWLTKDAQELFTGHYFQISNEADRMGYKMSGQYLLQEQHDDMISSAVSFGTVQLLSNGQIVVLMADHQTSGGYPRIAHVISADLPLLGQKKSQDVVRFNRISLADAEEKICDQKKYLQQLQIACKFRLEEFLDAHL